MWNLITGTVVPIITPFAAEENVDVPAIENLIGWLQAASPAAIMPTALTGEGLLLDETETRLVWSSCLSAAGPDIPVIPAILALRTATARRLARHAAELGAHAVLAAPVLPELYAGRSDDDVFRFYAELAAESELPIILFNYPSCTGVDLRPALVERLCDIPVVAAIKESSGHAARTHQLLRALGDRLQVICGSPTTALESLALGCTAWITGIMNVAPRSAEQLVRAMAAGDLELGRRIYFDQILPLADLVAASNNPTGTIKAGVAFRGVDVGAPRRPGTWLAATHQDTLREHCARLDLLEDLTDEALGRVSPP